MENKAKKTSYPVPDRSDFKTNQYTKDPVMREGDLGASVDRLPDGRPYRVESWWWEGYTLITLFFSELDLEDASPEKLLELVMPALVESRVPKEHRKLSRKEANVITDASGNRMYSLSFCVLEPD